MSIKKELKHYKTKPFNNQSIIVYQTVHTHIHTKKYKQRNKQIIFHPVLVLFHIKRVLKQVIKYKINMINK